ncbi:hypothetical protein EMPG_13286 [Blastomyces silverae]|uniref:Uncharacterized protein n=1 Tax=Blastomyces silverae TaxID=2060906 RepID=A0A0H1BQT1_9EURO|nr:hypothetical protein EMPG_13286 [Blastomyces silverae]
MPSSWMLVHPGLAHTSTDGPIASARESRRPRNSWRRCPKSSLRINGSRRYILAFQHSPINPKPLASNTSDPSSTMPKTLSPKKKYQIPQSSSSQPLACVYFQARSKEPSSIMYAPLSAAVLIS